MFFFFSVRVLSLEMHIFSNLLALTRDVALATISLFNPSSVRFTTVFQYISTFLHFETYLSPLLHEL